ncbi:SIMPL domain-containing protein [Polyangium jinanense]|uniref:SIMPL domain-containing protein n=1 Tax=Polyangium jinanense TaxID=2829994 RepID=A0A9X3XAZ3_9BACT|nr:SIMPL domain-containing protein [Polyangium jinanense]MDC3958865.1 SIMPL domain-containing protein [Polyangium jinanense]MDC3985980.1 SIMPL domain-containing protein [Polyangium jinanense]
MKKSTKLIAALAALMASAISMPVFADEAANAAETEEAEARTVTVGGLGEVMVAPDSLRTSISVRARATTLVEARTEAASKTRSIMQALERLRIPDMQVRTVEITVTPITERQREEDETPPRIIGYEAESRLSVALRGVGTEILRVVGPRILDTALGAGANVVGGIDFFLSKPREAYRLALAAAVRDAEENAKVVAGTARVDLRGLRTISTEVARSIEYAQQAVYEDYGMAAGGGSESVEFPVEPGEIRVTTQVTASFDFAE